MFARRPRTKSPRITAPVESAKELASRLAAHRPAAPTLVPPTTPAIQQILDGYGLVHAIDEDGDLVVRWERCNIFFFHYGERQEVLQARLYLNARFDVENRPALTVLLDDWNRTKLFPKAYTVLPDDGMVGVCAEHVFDFEAGATREQLTFTVGSWIHTLLRFADWIDEQV
ncbi:MAG: YbjN domain-containing protein [Actinomycetota bacterium]|nr:YbjN domain-containing protein [Actinomycetota bacterium]